MEQELPTRSSERRAWSWPGVRMLFVALGMLAAAGVLMGLGAVDGGWRRAGSIALLSVSIVLLVAGSLTFSGLTPVVPGEARVVQLFGGYHGTIRASGLHRVHPFARRRPLSPRVRNL